MTIDLCAADSDGRSTAIGAARPHTSLIGSQCQHCHFGSHIFYAATINSALKAFWQHYHAIQFRRTSLCVSRLHWVVYLKANNLMCSSPPPNGTTDPSTSDHS